MYCKVLRYAALLLVMSSCAYAQDVDCSAQLSDLQQVNVNLDTEVSNLKYHYQQAVAEKSALSTSLLEITSRAEQAESNTAAWETAYQALEAGKQGAEAKVTELEAQATAHSQLVASLRQQLAKAQEAPIAPPSIKSTSQPDWIAATTATATIILAELQAGNFTTLTGVAFRTQDAVATHATAAYLTCRDFVAREFEARAPEAKVQVLQILAKGQAMLQTHVGTLPAWKAVVVQYVAVEAEIKRQLLTAFTQVPALQGLADPVSVQLVTYAIFAILATLFLLPVIFLLCRPKRSSGPASPKNGGGKNKNKNKSGKSSSSGTR